MILQNEDESREMAEKGSPVKKGNEAVLKQ